MEDIVIEDNGIIETMFDLKFDLNTNMSRLTSFLYEKKNYLLNINKTEIIKIKITTTELTKTVITYSSLLIDILNIVADNLIDKACVI